MNTCDLCRAPLSPDGHCRTDACPRFDPARDLPTLTRIPSKRIEMSAAVSRDAWETEIDVGHGIRVGHGAGELERALGVFVSARLEAERPGAEELREREVLSRTAAAMRKGVEALLEGRLREFASRDELEVERFEHVWHDPGPAEFGQCDSVAWTKPKDVLS